MTIEQIKEKKEELESDIERLILIFEKTTNAQIYRFGEKSNPCGVGRRWGDGFDVDIEIILEGE